MDWIVERDDLIVKGILKGMLHSRSIVYLTIWAIQRRVIMGAWWRKPGSRPPTGLCKNWCFKRNSIVEIHIHVLGEHN